MSLSTEQIKKLSGQLDEMLSLPKSAWQAWVRAKDELDERDDPVQGRLRALLESGEFERTLAAHSLERSFPMPSLAERGSVARPRSIVTPGAMVGTYRLIERVSEGGMGSVWLAERADGAYKRRVALKLPLAGIHADALSKRFELERDILALLEHRNIARLYDAGSASGMPFIALEFVSGSSITSYCDDKKLDLRSRVQLFRQVLHAVQYAHSHLVIHRDLKPSNVLVTADGDVKLLDFGIAQLLGAEDSATHPLHAAHEPVSISASASGADTSTQGELTRAFGHVMTPRYASPEQMLGEPITTATDIYSLGVLLYRLLTLHSPYDVESEVPSKELVQIRDKIVLGDLRPVDSHRLHGRAIDSELAAIVAKPLSRRPNDRYGSTSEFDADLARYLAHVPVRSREQTAANRARLFFRRTWLPTSAVALSFASLTTFAGYVYFESEVQRRTKEFLLQALTPTSYYNDGGKVLTHAEMLNRAALGVDQKFADQPRVQTELYQAIGESLFNLGEHEDAFRVRTRAQPLIDATFGRTSREAIRNANRAAYMHLTQRRLPEFQTSLQDLLNRCPSIQTVAEDKCYGTIWLQTQYYAYTGEGAKRKALWDDYDARISTSVAADSRWHTIANYWGASAARQTGDMIAAKTRWDKLLALKATQDGAKGDHMTALSAVAMLRATGFHEDAATLGAAIYTQAERYMGEAFDQRLFYMPSVAEAQATTGVDLGGEALLRKGIASVEARARERDDPKVHRESADAHAALALVLLSKGRIVDAITVQDRAIALQSEFSVPHDQHLVEMKVIRLALPYLANASRAAERTQRDIQTLNEWRALALVHGDRSLTPRIDGLLSVIDAERSDE
ncbi:MAG: serine/threonine protein kinase, partial [Burkholderiales bacterium]